MICKKADCFTCPYPDCINDYVPPFLPLTEERKEQIRARGKARYQERKATGVCTRCGKRPPSGGKTKCWECLGKDARAHRDPEAIPRILFDGVTRCRTCGKPELEPGKKICPGCYRTVCRTLIDAREARRKKHFWDAENKLIFKRKEYHP